MALREKLGQSVLYGGLGGAGSYRMELGVRFQRCFHGEKGVVGVMNHGLEVALGQFKVTSQCFVKI